MTGGMPFIDMDNPKQHMTRVSLNESITCIETVRDNMRGLTLEQCTRAKEARDALAMMAHPPDKKMKHLVSTTCLSLKQTLLMAELCLGLTGEQLEVRL